jgi:hypothetical protein
MTDEDIIKECLSAIPVGHIPSHTKLKLPMMVKELVQIQVKHSAIEDVAFELKDKLLGGLWDHKDVEELVDLILEE